MSIRHLPLHEKHVAGKAKLGAFGDWEVPLYYSSILEEHKAVRTHAGLFDISHMGKFRFSGSTAAAALNAFLPRHIETMEAGRALYMPLLNKEGGMIDDIIVYRIAEDDFFMIVNAANIQKDYDWIKNCLSQEVNFQNLSDSLGLLALQGPKAAAVLQAVLGTDEFAVLKNYRFKTWKQGMIARTGYTGEDGYEIMGNTEDLKALWDELLKQGVVPVGFGARDTLRLEAGMPLYGHDMNDSINPVEAALDWAVDWKKDSFTGRDVLVAKKDSCEKKRIGFEMMDRGIPREQYEIQKAGQKIGYVTSGTFSPTLKKNIGMGYVPPSETAEGNEIEIQVRERALKAKIVKLPFYKRKK